MNIVFNIFCIFLWVVVVVTRSFSWFAPSLVIWNWCGFERSLPIPLGRRSVLVPPYWVSFNGDLEDVTPCDDFSNGGPRAVLIKPFSEQIPGLNLFVTISDFRGFCVIFSSSWYAAFLFLKSCTNRPVPTLEPSFIATMKIGVLRTLGCSIRV